MEPKQVIIVRKDLNMRKGKIAAQVAHASMKVILDLMRTSYNEYPTKTLFLVDKSPITQWIEGKFTKICVSVDSEEELLEIQKKANEAGIINALITDCGATEFHGVPTNTCLAIGPDWPNKIDEITGHLKLL